MEAAPGPVTRRKSLVASIGGIKVGGNMRLLLQPASLDPTQAQGRLDNDPGQTHPAGRRCKQLLIVIP